MELRKREDRIGIYLVRLLKDNVIFDELSYDFLDKAGLTDILKDVPVPIMKKHLNNISTVTLGEGMAFVMGADPNFKHVDSYMEYINKMLGDDFIKYLINEGIETASANDFDYACILFRAALLLAPDNGDALYCYGRACKDSYELGEEEDYIARYKAEALEAFEFVTLKQPAFDMGYYFLGYSYLNLGLYIKAKLTWDMFMELTKKAEDKKELREEIKERLDLLTEPINIEKGYNMVLVGDYDDGINVLQKYTDSKYNMWWPLWYYLGTAKAETERTIEAIEDLKMALKYSPSNIEVMEALIKEYEKTGNTDMVDKYTKKIELVKNNIKMDEKIKENME
jgi:tetratricopeptide (TPR) repeat protein